MITTYLSRVRDGERSLVFKKEGEKVAFWHIRLRTYPPMEPLGGLVKVDFALEEDSLSSYNKRIIDEVSAEIFALPSPSALTWIPINVRLPPRYHSAEVPGRISESKQNMHLFFVRYTENFVLQMGELFE